MDKERNGIMKELTMPKEVYLEEFDIHVKPYIPVDKVVAIGQLMVEAENYTQQELTLMVNVLVECTDIPADEIEEMDVDVMRHSGLWKAVQREISNVYDIWDYVSHEEDAYIAVAKFLNITFPVLVDKYIDRLPKEDEWSEVIDKLPKSLSDILEVAKEDGNADIIRGALKMGEVSEAGDE